MIEIGKADSIPHMNKTFQDRAKLRLKALDLSPSGASEKAGLSRETLPKLLKNADAMPGARTLSRLAGVLGTSEQWLLTGQGPEETANPENTSNGKTEPSSSDVIPAINVGMPQRGAMPADVPVMGTAAGSLLSGAFQMQGGVIDYVRRPPALSGARDIYALYVEGSSMEPRYFPGELVYVNPHKPPRLGDTVIVQEINSDNSPISASIGVLHKRTGGTVVLRKYNPPDAEITIVQTSISAIHRVLTSNELFGV